MRLGLVILAALMEAGFVRILLLERLDTNAPELILTYLLISIFYLVGCYLATRRELDRRLVWGAAIVFRLTLLPLEPTLSEDLARYRWQGKLQAAGGDPYLNVPEDPQWMALRDGSWPQVTRKDLPSVYGPVYELLNFGWYRLASWASDDWTVQVWSFKLPYALIELVAAWALATLLRALALPAAHLLIYLWSPLMVLEFWAQGHNDSLTVLFVLLALIAATQDRWRSAFSWLTGASLAKFWPLILFPFFLLQRVGGEWRPRWKPALISLPIAFVLCLPYLDGIWHVTEMLEGFVGGWRNNDSLFAWIWSWAGQDFDRATVLVSRILVGCLFAIWALQLPIVRAAKWSIVTLLFLSANCFPWYLSWLVPFLALAPNAALLMWTALVSLAYHIVIGYSISGIWQDSPEFRTLEYAPVFALLALSTLLRLRPAPKA